jgi:AAHS family 4-hydroxybenzoate transporter-like MFS transporter
MEKTVVSEAIHVPDIINDKKPGGFQYLIVSLCGLVMFLDGFDTQAISYLAPLIAKEWNLSREMLGPIFSSALTGVMAGYLVLSPVSDRFGHRRVLLVSTVTFALFTLATVFASSANELIALRFLAGVGLGGAIPSAVALTSEYSPKHLRATFVLAIYCGFSLGFVAAGVAAASLLPVYGWRSLFWIGAVAPLVLALVLFLRLPESLDFLVRSGADHKRIGGLLCRVDPRLTKAIEAARFTTDQEDRRNVISGIFQSGRWAGTLLLWLVFIINLGEFYALQSWLPTILTNLNSSISTVALVTSLTTVGGIVAAFVVGPAMDRFGSYRALGIVYVGGVISVALTGAALTRPAWVLLTTAFFAGFCVSGGQKSIIALAAVFYPAPVRSTGVGWALGVGRIGGIGGPLLFGMLLGWRLTPASAFYTTSMPMLLAAGAVTIMGRLYRADTTQQPQKQGQARTILRTAAR